MFAVLVLALLSGATHVVEQSQTTAGSIAFVRLKPADDDMRRLIVDGHERSAAFRALVAQVQDAKVIVVVQFGRCANGRFRSCVSDVSADAQQRYVRIRVEKRVMDDRLIATVAHELAHVIEILNEPSAVDRTTTLQLYRRIATGACRQGRSDDCETEHARKVESQVLDELDRAARR